MAIKSTILANKNSHIKDLALLFAIPIGIALFAAALIYIPRLLANPRYDFIYSICDDYDCKDGYSVDAAGYITHSKISSNLDYYRHTANIRYYDAAKDSTRSLTLEEALRYKLDTSSKSPDGYTLTRQSSNNSFLFWGSNDEGQYLENGARKKRVLLSNNDAYYPRDVKFLGWVNK